MRNQQGSQEAIQLRLSNFSTQNITCTKENTANLVCLNKNCQKPAFICNQQECECFSLHKKCLHISTQTLKSIIQQKEISLSCLQTLINDRIDIIIDRISDFRQKTTKMLRQNFLQFGLSQVERQFLQDLENGSTKGITGKKVWEIHLNLEKEEEILKSLQSAEKSMKKHFSQVDHSTQLFFIEIEQSIEKLRMESEHYLSNRNRKIFEGSRILKCHEEEVKIQMFFGKLKIKSVQMLYRASDNLFDIERFHNSCDNVPHTLTLCETEFGKIVGGYTPIPWQTLQNWEQANDETSCSFIFSLTNNDRFYLHQPSRAIIHRNDFAYGPQFGGGADLIIANKANINSNSFSRINTSYSNRNYQQYEKQSYKKFSGSETQFFRIKEWEVWRVEFAQVEEEEGKNMFERSKEQLERQENRV